MKLTYRRVAIVNRAEPALRLIHAVRELNQEQGFRLRTLALYTEPDKKSMFVREADEAFCLGPATFMDPQDGQRKSKYLDYAALERALVESRAQAAWVGWGFVAEHAEFAELCRKLGVVFIGPDAEVMRRVGDKIASKLLAESARVPVTPWSGGPVETYQEAVTHADRLGFPLMIKATAGGGGRGVRRVRAREELEPAWLSARSEALKYFGCSTVFVEQAMVGVRHVEVQVLGDDYGTCWAVGVRDCTLQRRHQKVVEEAPLPFGDREIERELGEAAVRLSRAAGYKNAGTVEFLFDPGKRAFYFMEMNTRLQVEHPVTEATTGIDLVKWQLALASGARLEGSPPPAVGHAIEVRLNAEDPDRQFSPAPGRVELFHLPTGPGLRIDTGVSGGDTIAPEFDSMIAKLIAYGRDRSEALARLRRALIECAIVIRGGMTNKAFLLELLSHPEVVGNQTDIGWLDRYWAAERGGLRPHAAVALVQAAIDVYDREFALEQKNFFVSASRGRPTVPSGVGRIVELRYQGQTYQLRTRRLGTGEYRVEVDGERVDVHLDRQGEFERWLTYSGLRHRVVSVVDGLRHLVEVDGVPHEISRDDGGMVRAPAPAVVLAIQVNPGDTVTTGSTLLILEAMKMETAVTAPCAGRVRLVKVRPNVQVAAGEPLVLIDPSSDAQEQRPTDRVVFGAPPGATLPPPAPPYHGVLDRIRRLMLGYDVDPAESKELGQSWASARAALAVDDQDAWRAENEVLAIFADLLAVYQDEPPRAFEPRLSAEENLHTYLRSVKLGGQGLPPAFVSKLERALRRYGVEGLEPTPQLDEALVFAHKAHGRRDECAAHVFALLEPRVMHADQLIELADSEFRELLDRLILATQDRYLPVNDLSREARFRLFDRPLLETGRRGAYRQVQAALECYGQSRSGDDCGALIRTLVECPYPLQRVLSHHFGAPGSVHGSISLEAVFRRFYRVRQLEHLVVEREEDRPVLTANYADADGVRHAVATIGAYGDLEQALRVAREALQRYPRADRVTLDLYLACDSNRLDPEEARAGVSRAFAAAGLPGGLAYICVIVSVVGRDHPLYCFTFVADESGGYREHDVHPGMHPMAAERLEVWRLKNFRTIQLPAPEHVYLFHAIARDNPRDERLFAFVDVYDTTPLRDQGGELLGLPNLEHLYLEAVAGIRQFQSRRASRERLHWNRIVLFLWSVMELTPSEMGRVAKRLAPASRNLGLEKTVVRLRVREEASGEVVERVLHISDRAGTGLRLQFDAVSPDPIRQLTPYAQKVVHMRRLGLVYPYEIIRMLTPSREGDQAEFPPGDFTEYDLDPQGGLGPVHRAPGLNLANVVVGLIKNLTDKHPEGMTRVMLLGDGSREMGALSDAECLRIIAALDLAEQMGVPVDWFPVSSGAKIGMDVGTEALDAVARVLRRLVEFTQSGGEVNVIVAGVNVGAQSYWNAEATMLMHTRGILVMTPQASMVLTGKRALDYSGGVSADTNQGIGGFERIMGPNGQAQYFAPSIAEACHILFRHYEHTYVAPGERFPRRARTTDSAARNPCTLPHLATNGSGFELVGDVFSADKNPGRKKPFDIRSVMRAVVDQDQAPLERWLLMRDAETAVTWDAHLGGIPVCLVGVESKPLQRFGLVPADGPETWTGGTLFPQSSKKVARAINGASGNRPVVILANLSGFDGSPESMRELQLEYGAEIGRAVVNFDGPLVFCVISRYHGGAYVVFSRTLNEHLEVAAVDGSHASVIGGAPAAAVVFPGEVKARTLRDPRIQHLQLELGRASDAEKLRLLAHYDDLYRIVYAEKQGEVAEHFDRVHSVDRAKTVGSLEYIIPASGLRAYLVGAVERGMQRILERGQTPTRQRVARSVVTVEGSRVGQLME
jgi:acetyl/propionyl-CoA carboxylase alpha subunit/acetyl-CoA carboxylase carboxyltransferase component